jgi:hypothetical protein
MRGSPSVEFMRSPARALALALTLATDELDIGENDEPHDQTHDARLRFAMSSERNITDNRVMLAAENSP